MKRLPEGRVCAALAGLCAVGSARGCGRRDTSCRPCRGGLWRGPGEGVEEGGSDRQRAGGHPVASAGGRSPRCCSPRHSCVTGGCSLLTEGHMAPRPHCPGRWVMSG